MPDHPDPAIRQLCERLHVAPELFEQSLQEAVIEIHEIDGRWDLSNGTVLRLRQLERICTTLDVNVTAALHLLNLTRRVSELEEEVRTLRRSRS